MNIIQIECAVIDITSQPSRLTFECLLDSGKKAYFSLFPKAIEQIRNTLVNIDFGEGLDVPLTPRDEEVPTLWHPSSASSGRSKGKP